MQAYGPKNEQGVPNLMKQKTLKVKNKSVFCWDLKEGSEKDYSQTLGLFRLSFHRKIFYLLQNLAIRIIQGVYRGIVQGSQKNTVVALQRF